MMMTRHASMTGVARGRRFAATRHHWVAALLLAVGAPLGAQATGVEQLPSPRRAMASRQELDSLAALSEAAASAAKTASTREPFQRYAADVRARLRDGDFQPGDRILLSFASDSALRDTFTVQLNNALALPKLPPIPLHGVLRSELQQHLASQLQQYVRDTTVRATPLVLVGVLGEVVRPGYYRVPLAIALGEALMAAGGPTTQADLRRVTVRRGNNTVVGASQVREAMMRGVPLAQLGIDAGDELLVVGPRARNWPMVLQITGVATGLVLAIHGLGLF